MRGISAAQGLRVLDLSNNSIICIEGILFSWSAMNDFPVIEDPVMCTGFWDQQGANIASRLKELYNLKFFSLLKAILYLTQEGVLIDRIYRINHTETYNLSAATLVTFALHKIMTKIQYSFSSYWKIIQSFIVWRNQRLIVI